MISTALALDGVREQLRDVVLPELEDERARVVVIAALGILADLALQVREDETWSSEPAARLRDTLTRRRGELPGDEAVLAKVDDLMAAAESAESPGAARRALLDAATLVLRSLWQAGAQASHRELLGELRRALAVDLDHQLARSR